MSYIRVVIIEHISSTKYLLRFPSYFPLFAAISGFSNASTVTLSLSELSVQTVEYMLSKYTSPLSLHLNKLQQGERKREAEGQEEGRMGGQSGDEARKKENIQVKQHLHVQLTGRN